MGVILDKNYKERTTKREISEEEFNAVINGAETNKYAENYSDKGFWSKVKGTVKKVGLSSIYKALQLYYVTENPNCPKKVKLGIYAALGYFITPLDFIPDFAPMIGYGDDASAIALALTMAHIYIDDTVKEKAKNKISSIFGEETAAKLQ